MHKLMMHCLGVLLLISGCATDPGVKPWWTLREANLRELRPGQSTKEDVIRVLGKPNLRMSFPRQGEEVWDYRYPDYSHLMLAWVYFDAQSIFKYYTTQPDPAYYSGEDR